MITCSTCGLTAEDCDAGKVGGCNDPSQRDTLPPSDTWEEAARELQQALTESNELALRCLKATERSSNLTVQLLQRLAEGDRHFREHDRELLNVDTRLRRLEERAGLPPLSVAGA